METVIFCGLLAACAQLGAQPRVDEAREETFQINSHLSTCTGLVETFCLMRRSSASAPWHFHYGAIVGFDYQWGTAYEVKVRVTRVAHPPADGSSLHYALVAILSATEVPRTQTFQITFRNVAQAVRTVDDATRRFAYSAMVFSCQPVQCAQLDRLAARGAPATLTFDHVKSPGGPLNLLSVM